MGLLKLVALDGDDINVVSAHLQDAVVKVEDIRWRPAEHRVVVGLSRFDWEAAIGQTPQYRRRLAAVRFDRVMACKCRHVETAGKGAALNLLNIAFSESDAPGGVVTLTFSGGATLRLEVECLEVELADLGPAWVTEACPVHAVDEEAADLRQQG
jgi:hypothetical protein